MKTNISNNKGMTMIEVITSMTLMVFILSSASVFINNTNSTKAKLSDISTATQIGTDLLENLRTEVYDSLNGGESDNSTIAEDYYKCKWAIDDSTHYKIVKLVVEWPYGDPKHDITLTTIIAK